MRPDPSTNPPDPSPIPQRPDHPGVPGEPEVPQLEPGPEVVPPAQPETPNIPPQPHAGDKKRYADGGGEPRELVIEHQDKHRTEAVPQQGGQD